jgi:hypothetical protein
MSSDSAVWRIQVPQRIGSRQLVLMARSLQEILLKREGVRRADTSDVVACVDDGKYRDIRRLGLPLSNCKCL